MWQRASLGLSLGRRWTPELIATTQFSERLDLDFADALASYGKWARDLFERAFGGPVEPEARG